MNKTISPLWGIVCALVFGAVIYGFTAPSREKPWTPPETAHDATYEFLQDVQRETGITFTFMIDKEFPWIVVVDREVKNMMITGKQWMAPEMTQENWTAISDYFMQNGFVLDLPNVGANPNQWTQEAYKKNNVVCTVVHMAHTQGNLILELPSGMTISCGINLLEEIPEVTTEESITNLIASALEIPRSQITEVVMEKTSWDLEGMHIVRGVYTKGEEPYPRMFIAKKTTQWEIVMSGDEGSVACDDLRLLIGSDDIPEDLLTSCFQE
ncbi:TPA: hypothetical protein DEP34_03910 [Candidatus Uhrbacteria bacterium]|uniref:Uncharacterized protein n=2 Tax=Candidatus Uhriibacteriota TaxID=1752732 RepID=A0A0G1T812_9BACT|nr:MAG: hypothetical protein UX45_C0005G0038 [Candidatus Uhrbacteria bacterium GW2011_GWF2_46_218]KKU41545.1 MAG: hypothetical protein UX57_C0003G0045 [Candidatus Uhrbacteria bacterium GW2011_GWE2_46_68]HBK33546.1 hypothetical protein [Candidatus Uhrbacteria bacterium]HCB19499.1 hypothetical protein [Candidatus Uhrbacteria bacterium]